MSSVRVNASKGGGEAAPHPGARPRAGDGADPAAGFAAALGATTASSRSPSDPPSNDPHDAPAGRDHAGDGHAATASDAGGPSLGTLPGLAGWGVAIGDQAANGIASSTGQRGSAKPGAAAAGAAAAAIAAALVAPAVQPGALAVPQFGHAGGDAAKAASVSARGNADTGTQAGDTTSQGHPAMPGIDRIVSGALDPGLRDPGTIVADPSTGTIAANLSTQAANPAHTAQFDTAQFDTAALAAAAPEAAAAALVAPIAASAGGSGTRDFADTGRDAQASAAAAFDGVASAGMGPPGGIGAPSTDAAAAAAPTAASADAGAANVAAQISGQVLRLLANSGHEAVVRLYPPDLGEVTVRVAVSGRDVTAWFGSPQLDVQQTISLGLGQLQADLANAGYSLNGAWVGADASGSGSGGGSQPPPPSAIAAAPAVPATQAGAALSSNTGVSIYV